jgi:catechol 2,3-dioxygenase-like lactoylglutathione lyase family enzyme
VISETVSPRIDHVMIAIPPSSEDEARAFYGALLGLSELEKPATLKGRGGVWYDTGSLQLHLGVDKLFVPATKAHVAFRVDELDKLRTVLEQAGHKTTSDDDLPGLERFHVDDPFGNRLEMLSPAS